MTGPRVWIEDVDGGAVKVHIRWPGDLDTPATTVLHGPLYGCDHLGYTTAIPAAAVELGPVPVTRRSPMTRDAETSADRAGSETTS
ncbi:MAG: hypothetical protein L0H84_21830 [Pseudonocardia sp.]|nr:hypothetical protein [Pseudonocardia sp.]